MVVSKMKSISNVDPQDKNYYKRLGLDNNSSSKEIKTAFFNLVKEYPPEKDPENHKPLREAYDTLIHPISKAEYDTRSEFGEVIEKLELQLNDAEEVEDIDEEIKILKKILNTAPDLGMYRNKLGLAFMEKEQFGYAFAQFRKANKNDPENSLYLLNMGDSESERGNYKEAGKLYNQSWDLDKDDYSAPRALARMYFEKQNLKNKAHEILDESIEADGLLDFQDFFCIYDKIQYYALDNDRTNLKRELRRINKISSKNEEKDFAAFMLYRTGGQLYELNIFDLSIQFLETAHSLLPEDSEIERFYNECKKQSKLVKNIKKINDSDSVHEMVKALVGLYAARYYGEIDQQEFEDSFDEFKNIMMNVMDTEPYDIEVKKSFKYIRQYYIDVYNLNSDLFDAIISLPDASSVSKPCPYCRENVKVRKYQFSIYECPHCLQNFEYSSSGYTKYSSPPVGGNDGCFIATATFGSGHSNEVKFLRAFRDNHLMAVPFGRIFVTMYYYLSPPIAKLIKRYSFLKKLSMNILLRIIQIIKN
jgi:tetratricopeptide (TPR) repeat protein